MTFAEKMRFVSYDDKARLEYGRKLWKREDTRKRLLTHWEHPEHPYAERWARHQALVTRVLEASPLDDETLDQLLDAEGWSLRAVMREIPPVFGRLWSSQFPRDDFSKLERKN